MPKFGGASFSTPKLVYGLVLSLKPASPATLKYTLANLLWVSVLASLSTTLQSLLENWNSFRSTGGDEYSDWKLVHMHVAPCRPTGTLLPSRQPIKLKHGETHQLQKGNQLVTLWFDNCQVAVLSSNFSLNQTVTVQRMKEAPHIKSIPSLHAINTWEVLIWKTSWDLTIPLVAQELSGGNTFCGSSLMLRS